MKTTGSALRGPHLRFTRELELHLRRHGPAFPDAASLQAWAARSDEQARHDWVDWLGACIDMAMPLVIMRAADLGDARIATADFRETLVDERTRWPLGIPPPRQPEGVPDAVRA